MTTTLSIIVVTYDSLSFIRDCVESIFVQTYKKFEIIVVDNNSQDKTVEFIKKNYPQIRLIENGQNRGFPYACNQGIEATRGKYILTLNSDVTLEEDFLYEIKRAMDEADPEVGLISPKILWAKDKKLIDSTGLMLSRARRFFDRGRGEVDKSQYDREREIFGPCAAAALYKREMLKSVEVFNEYFDPDFFLLLEDFDLAWKAKNLGWKALFVPEARCYHMRNISGRAIQYAQYLCFRNRYFLLVKNDNIRNLFKDIIFILIYDILRLPYFLVINRYAVKAIRELKMKIPDMFKKRKMILLKKGFGNHK